MTSSTLYPRIIKLFTISLLLGTLPLATSHAGHDELK